MALKIALAGATGNLGGPVLKALLHANLHVTVLSRIGGNSSKIAPHSNLTVKEVDFNSVQSLVPALEGVEVVVSCLATLAIGSQNPLIDAAEAVGVRRFIPAEFGMDSLNPLCVQLPVCAPKAATQRYLIEKYSANSTFTYTAIANGLFLDWGLKVGFIVNPSKHTATLYNGGDVPFSATNLADVAQAVLGIVKNQAQTANRVLYIHSTVTTQNKLIQYAKEKDGKEWNTICKSTEEVKQESEAELNKGGEGNINAAMDGFCICACWNPDYGCDFSGHLDNELLGIKTLDESDLRALIEDFLG
ncbi:hypothetical protein BGW36DRAFT_369059 [Talaromyces proteolyticus]|uniref:NmrA-like domain-containing protein n=1 Tax=Talaromyces proteolyticus TaxID=1131652 RepID=A0AAD4KZ25_9EURO|nr:uncharacterized protein BGW36DRAFT_369059 [Talaromyces proteolyticus]KAH8703259.1 hypothetical protein BGW36DRAFT_369059 [Talaromyces proteolyticus]